MGMPSKKIALEKYRRSPLNRNPFYSMNDKGLALLFCECC